MGSLVYHTGLYELNKRSTQTPHESSQNTNDVLTPQFSACFHCSVLKYQSLYCPPYVPSSGNLTGSGGCADIGIHTIRLYLQALLTTCAWVPKLKHPALPLASLINPFSSASAHLRNGNYILPTAQARNSLLTPFSHTPYLSYKAILRLHLQSKLRIQHSLPQLYPQPTRAAFKLVSSTLTASSVCSLQNHHSDPLKMSIRL